MIEFDKSKKRSDDVVNKCRLLFRERAVEPGEGDVGGDGEAEEGPDGEEHAVGGDEGEEEDAKRGENQRAVHHEKRIHKCKIGKPPQMLYLDLQYLVDDC